jgi:hypothetical protein
LNSIVLEDVWVETQAEVVVPILLALAVGRADRAISRWLAKPSPPGQLPPANDAGESAPMRVKYTPRARVAMSVESRGDLVASGLPDPEVKAPNVHPGWRRWCPWTSSADLSGACYCEDEACSGTSS